jgi:predicted glycosyltransferase
LEKTAVEGSPRIMPFPARCRRVPRRVALYSHDTMGLGHTRRNLLIAQALTVAFPGLAVLLIAGARAVNAFRVPPGVDCLTLPALHKDEDGQYAPESLGLPLEEVVALRARAIRAALEAFEPDLFVADKEPRGALGELEPALAYLSTRPGVRCVLGLRDILDDPATVRREWRRGHSHAVIRDHYDAIWVYGDRRVYDAPRSYGFPAETAAKVCYTGYLDQCRRLDPGESDPAGEDDAASLGLGPGRLALCLVGGGQDGARLAEAFAKAALPDDMNGLILTGPYMPEKARQRLSRLAAGRDRLRVVEFVTEPTQLVRRAERIVAMGGYNTVLEVLSFERPALIVPRVRPRAEQLVRAQRLHALGLLELLHPDELRPAAIAEWLARPVDRPAVRARVDLDGFDRLPALAAELLDSSRRIGHETGRKVRYAAR